MHITAVTLFVVSGQKGQMRTTQYLASWHLLSRKKVVHEGSSGAGQLVVAGIAAAWVGRVVSSAPWAPRGATLRWVGRAAFFHPTRGLTLVVGP